MNKLEPRTLMTRPVEVGVMPTGTTWRYLGERAAADLAYCARFGVVQAPEPMMLSDDILAYTLPAR